MKQLTSKGYIIGLRDHILKLVSLEDEIYTKGRKGWLDKP